MENEYFYIHPFYKSLSRILTKRSSSPVKTEIVVGLLELDCVCLPSEPSMIVQEYWNPWWLDPNDPLVGDTLLDGFSSFRSQVQ
jgi:hypothetical protein